MYADVPGSEPWTHALEQLIDRIRQAPALNACLIGGRIFDPWGPPFCQDFGSRCTGPCAESAQETQTEFGSHLQHNYMKNI